MESGPSESREIWLIRGYRCLDRSRNEGPERVTHGLPEEEPSHRRLDARAWSAKRRQVWDLLGSPSFSLKA